MTRTFIRTIALTAAVTALASAAPARAGSLNRTLFRGLERAGSFNLLSDPQNGPFFNDNTFNQRLEYNRAGGGYTYEQWRFFGQDTYGNPNSLDLGPIKIDLGSDPNILASTQGVGVHSRVGYTTTLIPEVFFSQQTGQRFQNQFSSESGARLAPLHYNVTLNTGVQDLAWNGNMSIDTEGRINALGFYDLKMNVINEGTFTANGALVTDNKNTDFQLGPINVSGNLLIDGISSLTQVLGGTAEAIPFRITSGGAQKDKSLDQLLSQIQRGEELSDDDARLLAQYALTSTLMHDQGTVDQIDRALSATGEGLNVQLTTGEADAFSPGGLVPEPGTLALLLTAYMGVVISRSSRRSVLDAKNR